MIEVAQGLHDSFEVTVCALDLRSMTVEMSTRGELLARFGEVSFIRSGEQLEAAFAAVDVVLWYGMNHLTASTLEGMQRRPLSIRVVHTQKVEEGEEYHERWRHCIDAVVCVSPQVQRRIAGSTFIPNTVSMDRLRGPARCFFPDLGGPRRTLGWVGRLFGFKNIPWLIENAAALDCNLLIQGIDTEEFTRSDLERFARDRDVASRVRFLRPDWDVGTLMKSVDAIAIVSEQEGFPMVAIEAGMVGKPLIATRVGALPELFADEIRFVDYQGTRPGLLSMRRALDGIDASWGTRLHDKVVRLCSREAVIGRYADLIGEVYAGSGRSKAGASIG